MIKLIEQININAEINTIWNYLINFSQSLNYNRFHTSLELPPNYSLGKLKKFIINHNFGFGNYKMVAEIKYYAPPTIISIAEYCAEDPKKGFPHTVEYQIKPNSDNNKLHYKVVGTYGGRVQDISFRPILKGVMIEELIKIKHAVESSELSPESLDSKTIKSI